eukprot:TRINITY_DN1479_c1_g1_i24.p3 TRINITY_DN1479_c1_g1~~TRINITY_DN1479_c1_g1_i24.p3  ORF type:complete len:122 (+),score=14.77 TRINITY_DN1479_c1_g1_i24:1142-1507(+)
MLATSKSPASGSTTQSPRISLEYEARSRLQNSATVNTRPTVLRRTSLFCFATAMWKMVLACKKGTSVRAGILVCVSVAHGLRPRTTSATSKPPMQPALASVLACQNVSNCSAVIYQKKLTK